MGWRQSVYFWTDPFNAKCVEETIAVFLIPLFDFVCTAKEIKNKFKPIVDGISQGSYDKLFELADKISEEKGLSKIVLNAQIADLTQYKRNALLIDYTIGLRIMNRIIDIM